MKTIITSSGDKLTSNFDLRFGRAQWFCLYDETTGETSFHVNPYLEEGHGTGPKVAQFCFELGAEKIISGDFGPKAKDLLEKLKIQMVIIDNENQSIRNIIKQLKK